MKTKMLMEKKIPHKIVKNKKGVISITGIISGAGQLLGNLFEVMPKPVKFLFFLLIILILGGVIHFGLQVFGVYCDSGNNPVYLGANIFSNIGLMDEIPNPEIIGLEAISTGSLQKGVEECSVCYDAGTIIYEDGSTEGFTKKRCFYNGRGGCVLCELAVIDPDRFQLTQATKWCIGDAIRKDREDMSIMQKWTCGAEWFGRCEPPEHYYYDYNADLYVCGDETCSGITAGQIWDEKLQSKGAKPIYPEGQIAGKGYKKFIGITCYDLKPVVSLYGIPIFDYKIWVFLTLIGVIFWIIIKIKKD